MKFKKIKFLSSLLSATAIASMTGAPALANEVFQLGGGTEEAAGEAAASGSIEQFLGAEAAAAGEEVKDTEEAGADGLFVLYGNAVELAAEDSAEEAEASGEVVDGMYALRDRVLEAEPEAFADEAAYADAADTYNAAVLPELTVSITNGNVFTGIHGDGILAARKAGPTASSLMMQKPEAADGKLVVASPNVYLNIHQEPSLGSEVVGKMYSNDVAVELRKADDRWTRIRSGNLVGYVMSEYLVDGDQAQALSEIVSKQVATIDKSSENEVFQEASGYSKVIAEAAEGDQYEVMEGEDGWLTILTEDGEGYIPASEVSLSMAYPVAESAREEEDRMSRSNVKERADHEQRKADKADAVAALAQARADVASGEDEETAMAVVEVALRAADAAAAQAEVAQVAVSQAGAESGQAVIEFATQFIGNPYVWGGSSLTHGADCSGFVMAVYGNFGFRLPHYDVSDRSVGSPVASLAEARAGDIICYYGHVALYMGDGMIVHAQDERHGITTSSATFMHIVCIRRLFN